MIDMSLWIKLNSSSAGKDKIARLLQYCAKLLQHRLNVYTNIKEVVRKLQIFEALLSNFRRVLRLGKSFEILNGALSTLRIPDPFIRVVATLARCHSALYLILDNVICLQKAGILQVNTDKIRNFADKFWLASILLNLSRDFYEIMRIVNDYLQRKSLPAATDSSSTGTPVSTALLASYRCHRPVVLDTLRNMCDVLLPLNNLRKITVRADVIGLLGAVSSCLALFAVIEPSLMGVLLN